MSTPDKETFLFLCKEAVLALDPKIAAAKQLARQANEITQRAMDFWNSDPMNQELYANFKEADRVSDGLTSVIIDLQDAQDHLKYPDKELLNSWINKKSKMPSKNSSNPLSTRQQEVKLLLNLALTQMKSSAYRLFSRS